jgi:hypothetical protein
MSTKPLAVTILSKDEFKKLERLDRLYYHLIDPHRYSLNPQDEDYYDVLKTVYVTACENIDDKTIMKVLQTVIGHKVHDARYLMTYLNDAEKLFGSVRQINKQFLTHKTSQRLLEHIKYLKAEQPKGYMDTIAKLEATYIKLLRLDQKDSEQDFDYSSLVIPAIEYSDDPKYLEEAEIVGDEEE